MEGGINLGLKILFDKLWESTKAVLPISIIILIASLLLKIEAYYITSFLIGDVLLILGLTLFSLGSLNSTIIIAESIGEYMVKRRKILFFILVAFIVGFLIVIAEPAIWVLADQFKAVVAQPVLITTVAIGVGLFTILSLLRILTQIPLRTLFIATYFIVFFLAGIVAFVNPDFISFALDSGGVTTGPMAVPFIMALGLGISRARGDKSSQEDSFGLIGIVSAGPMISVLILGLFVHPSIPVSDMTTTLWEYFVVNLWQMLIAISPFVLLFIVFQSIALRYNRKKMIKTIVSFLYTYVGLVLFLTGANAGLVNIGTLLGRTLALDQYLIYLLPTGILFGLLVVSAEPSVIALNRQVERVSAGAISRKLMMGSLAIAVAIGVGLACLRIVYSINFWWIILPGYILVIILSFLSPKIFSAIAFDAGGAVSGVMTTTFLMPFALGVATTIGENILTGSFGLMSIVAMTPLITIQILGIIYRVKLRKASIKTEEDEIIHLKEEENETIHIHSTKRH